MVTVEKQDCWNMLLIPAERALSKIDRRCSVDDKRAGKCNCTLGRAMAQHTSRSSDRWETWF